MIDFNLDLEQEYLSPKQFARLVPGGVAMSTVWRWLAQGAGGIPLPSISLGKRKRRIAKAAALEFLRRLAEPKNFTAKPSSSADEDLIERELEALTA